MSKYCTYKSSHPSGFFYLGKGITSKVEGGTYKGSGVRFKLSLTFPGFHWDSWTTVVLDTFDTEEQAYEAEAALVPASLLANPFCLNMTAGGRKGKYKNASSLLRTITAAEKAQAKAARLAARKERLAKVKEKTASRLAKAQATSRALRAKLNTK